MVHASSGLFELAERLLLDTDAHLRQESTSDLWLCLVGYCQGLVAARRGRPVTARHRFARSLSMWEENHYQTGDLATAQALDWLAAMLTSSGLIPEAQFFERQRLAGLVPVVDPRSPGPAPPPEVQEPSVVQEQSKPPLPRLEEVYPQRELTYQASWESHLQHGLTDASQQRYEQAFETLNLALEAAHTWGAGDLRVCLVLSAMSILMQIAGDGTDAEKCYRDALSLWVKSSYSLDRDNTVVIEGFARMLSDRGWIEEGQTMVIRLRAMRAGDSEEPPLLVPRLEIKLPSGQTGGARFPWRAIRVRLAQGLGLTGLVGLLAAIPWLAPRLSPLRPPPRSQALVGPLELTLRQTVGDSPTALIVQLEVRNDGKRPETAPAGFELQVMQEGREVYRATCDEGAAITVDPGEARLMERSWPRKRPGPAHAIVKYGLTELQLDL